MNRRRITDLFQIDSSETLGSEVIELLRLIYPAFQTDSIHTVFNSVNGARMAHVINIGMRTQIEKLIVKCGKILLSSSGICGGM